MTTSSPSHESQMNIIRPPSEIIISSVCLIVFSLAFVATFGWPIEAARFPRVITLIGAISSGALLLSILVRSIRASRRNFSEDTGDLKYGEGADEAEGSEESDVGYVFSTAGSKAWVRALLWIGSFFILNYLVGVYLAGGIFAALYLRFGGRKSWIFACVYALVLAFGIWGLFDQLLELPLPSGLLGIV